MYQKYALKKIVDLVLIKEESKKHYVHMYDHTLHGGKKHFHHYFLQAFSIEKILKCHVKGYWKNNGK